MSRLLLHAALAASLFVSTLPSAHAALESRFGGLAYYDTVLDITWLADANAAAGSVFDNGFDTQDGRLTWASALAWAENLVVEGTDGWRLPSNRPINGSIYDINFSNNGTTDAGGAAGAGWVDHMGLPASEMGHLFYVTLGGLYFCTPNGGGSSTSCNEQPGWGLPSTGPFENIQTFAYWSDKELAADANSAWIFAFSNGARIGNEVSFPLHAWAVHDGDVGAIVPLPGGIWLLAGGVVAMLRTHRRA